MRRRFWISFYKKSEALHFREGQDLGVAPETAWVEMRDRAIAF
jgi:hypothetical protein